MDLLDMGDAKYNKNKQDAFSSPNSLDCVEDCKSHIMPARSLMKQSSNIKTTRSPNLRSHSSKLHLIDNTTLTSLPFPPPAVSKRIKRTRSSKLHETKGSETFMNEDNIFSNINQNLAAMDKHSHNTTATLSDHGKIEEDTNFSFADETFEETFDELQDPIVLVEDYLTETHSEEYILRKKSLADIKQKLRNNPLKRPHASRVGSYNDEESRSASVGYSSLSLVSSSGPENLEAIFGKLPGSEKLKYCTLCDKPLYEISSVLSCTDTKRPTQVSSPSKLYQEFVCWGCIDAYEQILNELHELEMNNPKVLDLNSDTALCTQPDIRSDMLGEPCQIHEEKQNSARRINQVALTELYPRFSTDLIERLHHLIANSQPRNKSSEMLADWHGKLRQSLHNLLSSAFASDGQTS